jgi:diadenosine tetraphosphatase ApaH/serine/threonine PP2A family protein phosphatase
MPTECLARLRALDGPVHFIRGNGEAAVLDQLAGRTPKVPEPLREVLAWVAGQVDAGFRDWLADWPATLEVEIEGLGRTLFCHATPRNDTEIFTRLTPEDRLRPIFEPVGARVVVCGHTHMQFDRMVGAVRVVNAGSVGMPFMAPGAYWLQLGPGVDLHRSGYDLEATAATIRGTRYPQASQFADDHVLRPPSEEAMLEALAKAELR